MRRFCAALALFLLQMAPLAAQTPTRTPLHWAPAASTPSLQPLLPMKAPIRVVIVRSAETGCEPDCAQWISAEGDIALGAEAEFSRAFAELGNRKLPILINSRGGSVNDALAIGRLIRARQLDIAVAKTRFASCQPDDHACQKDKGFHGFLGAPDGGLALCASACAYLFAGGVHRYVGALSVIGLHQSTIKRAQILTRYWVTTRRFANGQTETTRKVADRRMIDLGSAAQTSEQEYQSVAAYLDQMGVSSKELLAIVLATPTSTIHWMTPTELLATNLFTERHDGPYLVARASQAAMQAYFASPEYRTFAYAHAMVPMGLFGEREAMLALDFSHRKNASDIDLTITPTSDGALLPTLPLEVDLHLTSGKTFAALNTQPRQPDKPLMATIPVAAFCDLTQDSMVKISLEPTSSHWLQGAALYTDARRFTAMDELLTEVCKK